MQPGPSRPLRLGTAQLGAASGSQRATPCGTRSLSGVAAPLLTPKPHHAPPEPLPD